jgi:hypothetical protein
MPQWRLRHHDDASGAGPLTALMALEMQVPQDTDVDALRPLISILLSYVLSCMQPLEGKMVQCTEDTFCKEPPRSHGC